MVVDAVAAYEAVEAAEQDRIRPSCVVAREAVASDVPEEEAAEEGLVPFHNSQAAPAEALQAAILLACPS